MECDWCKLAFMDVIGANLQGFMDVIGANLLLWM